jgi:uncharacterized protein YbjT (DUF2867 family)
MARTPSKLSDVPWRAEAEVVAGDLGDLDSLIAAFDGIDVVYYLVHSMGTSKDFAAEEGRAAVNVAKAARQAGVRRLVYLSGLHPSGAPLSPHLQSRVAVGDILIATGIETIVLQAGVVIGSGSASFEMVRHLTDRLPVMTTPKWVHNKIQPIAIADVLHYLVAAASAEVPTSRTWDIGGPDVLEYGDMMQTYAEIAGLSKRYIIVLPLLTPTIASWWVGLVTPIPAGLARPLVESLHCDAVMGNHDIDTIIARPPGGLTRYRRAVALALSHIARGQVETSWSDAAATASPSGTQTPSGPQPPSGPLPTDPVWAGGVAYTDTRSAMTSATCDQLFKVVESTGAHGAWWSFPLARRTRPWSDRGGWSVEVFEPGDLLRLRAEKRAPGDAWLEMRVTAAGSGSRYDQRAIFFPRGLAGRLYWFALLPVHTLMLRRVMADIVGQLG